ncbi:MAG: hypothetical protein K9L88_00900 [Chromatiaceae bacterium]|nr:hypothetical protein [Chromatiaceae bacterium]
MMAQWWGFSGQASSAADRWRARIERAGLKRVTVVVPVDRVDEIKAIAARMLQAAEQQTPPTS